MKKKTVTLLIFCSMISAVLLVSCNDIQDVSSENNEQTIAETDKDISIEQSTVPQNESSTDVSSSQLQDESSSDVQDSSSTSPKETQDETMLFFEEKSERWELLELAFFRDVEKDVFCIQIFTDPFDKTITLSSEEENEETLQNVVDFLDYAEAYLNGTYDGPITFVPGGS